MTGVARRTRNAALASLGALLAAGAAFADDWPQYRGPARTGISKETGLATTWPEKGPKQLWNVPLGDGYSGIAVSGDRVCTMYARGEDEFLACFDARTGAPAWKVRTDENRFDDQGSGPRSTPTIDGGVVFAVGAKGMLFAVKLANGETIWSKDLKVEYGARVPRWGVSTSPLVEGDLLILDVGGKPGSSLVAMEKGTGRTRWTAYDDKPGYATPIAVTMNGVRQIVSFAGTSVVGVDLSGNVLWNVPWTTSYDVNAAAPVLVPPDMVFISSGYDKGAALFRLKKGESGAFEVEEVWKSRVMKNHFNSSILYGGHIYGFDNGTLKCIDAHTGDEKWAHRGFAKGSLLIADGHLVILGESGQLALADATPGDYVETAQAQVLEGRTWTMPSLAGGVLYLRNQEEMVALDISG